MEIDECDNGKEHNDAGEPMDEDYDGDVDREGEHDVEYNYQSGDEDETDATETSDQYTKRKTTAQRQQQTNSKRRINASKLPAARKLILKTPNMTPAADNNSSILVTPIGRRTRGKKGAKVKRVTLSSPVSKSKTKTTKSTTKRGSTTKTPARKSSSSSSTAVSTASEIEHQQQESSTIGTKRERRTRRCLLKTDLTTAESLHEDDSNSNFSPDVKGLLWKFNNTEAMHSRNYKK